MVRKKGDQEVTEAPVVDKRGEGQIERRIFRKQTDPQI